MLVHVAVLAVCVTVALAFTWPLPRHYRTHLLGDPQGDMGVYVWNNWAFREELVEHGHNPLRTDLLFVPAQGVGLALHNYTILADMLSVPFQKPLGLVATFNLVQWLMSAANAYAMFLLARRLTRDSPSALLAGLAFGFSPFLITRAMGHPSLAMAAALPVFLLFVLEARDSMRYRHAVLAGLALAAAALSDAYYGMYGLLMGAWVLGTSVLSLLRREHPDVTERWPSHRAAELVAVAAAMVVAWVALTGGGDVTFAGRRIAIRTPYTPVLILSIALVVRGIVRSRARLSLRPGVDWVRGLRRVAAGLAVTCLVCLPLLHVMVRALVGGRYVEPAVEWRSGPRGVDLVALLLPNPNHVLWSWEWLHTLPNGYVENVASQSLVALAVVVGVGLRDRRVLPGLWLGFTAFFVSLSLGPFIQVGGVNTYLPTPWTLLRYVPILANAHSATRFAVVVTLGVALLFAFAVQWLRARTNGRAWPVMLLAAALLLELAPAERRLFPADVPSVYTTIAADPRPVSVLELPFGVRSGASGVGDFSPFTMFCQAAHGKAILGGYLSRVSEQRVEAYRAHPMTAALLQFSSGRTPSPAEAQAARDARKDFLRETRLGYVVVDTYRASERMQRFAANALHLEPIGADGRFDLYAVANPKLD